MPLTPFHLPPSTLAGWPLRRWLDLPTLLLVNLAIDVEPLIVNLLGLQHPPHGYVHTLLGATVAGAATGWLVWRGKALIETALRGRYLLELRVAVASGVIGGWLHVVLDAVMYAHIRPFFPWTGNPLYWPSSGDALHLLSALALLPVLVLVGSQRYWQTPAQKITAGLLVAAGIAMAVSVAAGAV